MPLCGVECCLVLRALVGRPRGPNSEPTWGVAGVDMPPGRLTC